MTKKSLYRFLIFNFIIMTVFNFAHPVTPRMIQELQLPDEMFGVFFALMSIGSFIMAPIWGSLSDYKGRKRFLMFGVLGYGITQLGFGLSTTIPTILLFRLFGGAISTSYVTVIMAVIADLSKQNNRAKALAYLAATSSLGAAVGSLMGGYLGQAHYQIPFITQFISCLALCVALYTLTTESLDVKKEGQHTLSFNHLKIRKGSFDFTSLMGAMIVTVALLNITTTAYSSTISYYVESVLKLPTQLNGMFLAFAPIAAVLTNFFVSPYIGARFNELKSLVVVVSLIGFTLLGWAIFDGAFAFIFLLSFVVIVPLAQPIYQAIITKLAKDNAGEVLGLQSSARSLGMILGSLLSGYIFKFGAKLPFLLGACIAILAALILIKRFNDLNKAQT